jgi:hypothetical protein
MIMGHEMNAYKIYNMNIDNTGGYFFISQLKFRVILIDFALLNLNMSTKLPCHPLLRERGLN